MENIFIVAIGIALLYLAFQFRLNTQKLSKNGIETEGVVFDLVPGSSIESRASYPVIRFVTLEKEWITEKYSISAIPGFFKKGQKVTIVHNPDNPKDFFVKSTITSVAPMLAMTLAIIILGTGVYKLLHVKL